MILFNHELEVDGADEEDAGSLCLQTSLRQYESPLL
jgi:hypothetical protein